MEHEHNITSKKVIFLIDPETRKIKTSDGSVPVIAQYDHNSTKIIFEMTRYIDGHDMAASSCVQVHYINTLTSKRKSTPGVYEAQELTVKADNDNVVTFSWKISANATQFAGTLCFSVRFYCGTDGETTYSWGSDVFDNIRVVETYDNSKAVAVKYPDILDQWHSELFDGTGTAGGPASRIAYINLIASKWEGAESPFSQIVNIDGVTENTQVDIKLSKEQIEIFRDKKLTFLTENENGVVTVYAFGQKLQNDYTIQVKLTEVIE